MTAYRMQQYLYDQLGRWSSEPGASLDATSYELDTAELDAVSRNDIGALYALGVHPVLLNAWCRATGFTRDQYRELLAPYRQADDGRKPRWRASA